LRLFLEAKWKAAENGIAGHRLMKSWSWLIQWELQTMWICTRANSQMANGWEPYGIRWCTLSNHMTQYETRECDISYMNLHQGLTHKWVGALWNAICTLSDHMTYDKRMQIRLVEKRRRH
jgi:hypothetical protein